MGGLQNSNHEKIVMAPERWFVNNNMQADAFDIYPNNWIKL
jgi:hypothetical protein